MADYRDLAGVFKEKANQFLAHHNVIEILSEIGDLQFFGSYELDLMNRNDIDIAIIVDEAKIETVMLLMQRLNKNGFNRHWIFDNTDGGCSEDPKHIVYEAVYGFYHDDVKPEDRWEVGMVITTPEILPDVIELTEIVKALPDNLKDIILQLKFELAEKYGKHKYTGTQVYNAVIDGKCRTIADCEKYINS